MKLSDYAYQDRFFDVTGDGVIDFLWRTQDQIWVWKGRGDGRFLNTDGNVESNNSYDAKGAFVSYLNGIVSKFQPGQDVYWDVNLDGKLDMVLSGAYVAAGRWALISNGDGTFRAPVNLDALTNGNLQGLARTDVNGDGRLDTVINIDGSTNGLRVYLQFQNGVYQLVDGIADLNGDGRNDAWTSTSATTQIVWLQLADGRFYNADALLSDADQEGLAALAPYYGTDDIDANGLADLRITWFDGDADGSNNPSAYFLKQADGTYRRATILAGDVNADGRPELIAEYRDGTSKAVFYNADGSRKFVTNSTARGGQQVLGDVDRADIDGDGLVDNLFRDTLDQLWVAKGNSDGGYAELYNQGALVGAATTADFDKYATVLFGDVTGDDKVDAVAIDATGQAIFRTSLEGAAAAGNIKTLGYLAGLSASVAPVGTWSLTDLNNDGRLDLVLDNPALNGTNRAVLFKADGSVLTGIESRTRGAQQVLGDAALVDVDGDGDLDSVYRDTQNRLWLAKQDGAAKTFAVPTNQGALVGAATTADFDTYATVLFGDVTGDNKADAIAIDATGQAIFRTSLEGATAAANTKTLGYLAGLSASVAPVGAWSLADLNNDGRLDLVLDNPALNGKDRAVLFKADGTVLTGIESRTRGAEQVLGDAALVDVDADGDLDSVYRDTQNRLWLAKQDGAAKTFAVPTNQGALVGAATTADFDTYVTVLFGDVTGDNKADAIAIDATGQAILRTSLEGAAAAGNTKTLGYLAGLSASVAPVGTWSLTDLNNDGRLDLLFTRVNGIADVAFAFAATATVATALYGLAASGVAVDLATGTTSGPAGAGNISGVGNLTGSAFADTLTGSASTNELSGGAGDDVLSGGAGDDVYVFGRGDDGDTIVETGGADTLRFRQAITARDLVVAGTGNDLIVRVKPLAGVTSTDSITVKSHYATGGQALEQLDFADGTRIQVAQLVQAMAGFGIMTATGVDLGSTDKSVSNALSALITKPA